MTQDSAINRRLNRLLGYDYRQTGLYFVTLCTFQRQHHFGKLVAQEIELSPIGKIVRDRWLAIADLNAHVDLDVFTIMPNHIHGIIWIDNDAAFSTNKFAPYTSHRAHSGSLGRIISSFKGACSRRVKMESPLVKIELWQRNYYDHIVRNEADLLRIRDYILNNPTELFLKRTEGSPRENPYATS